jgi:hypothetical protein
MSLKKRLFAGVLIAVLGIILPYAVMLVFYREINVSAQNFAKQDFLFTLSVVGSAALAVFSFFGRQAAVLERSRKYKIIFACLGILGILLALVFLWLFNAVAVLRYAII